MTSFSPARANMREPVKIAQVKGQYKKRKNKEGCGKYAIKCSKGWLPYQAMGKQIAGTRFICFKVPLKEQICKQLDEVKRFTPQHLLEQCPEMKLIVDLTNTNRFYDGKVFEDSGVKYKKIPSPGHVIPDAGFVQEFFIAVDAFLSSSTETDSLIGVHCTHGLNRTSYFVCCYMIHRMGFEPQAAVTAFEDARGHKIERQYYVDDLLRKGMGSKNCRPSSIPPRFQHGQDRARDDHRNRNNNNKRPEPCRNWREEIRNNPIRTEHSVCRPGKRISHGNRPNPNPNNLPSFNNPYPRFTNHPSSSNVPSHHSTYKDGYNNNSRDHTGSRGGGGGGRSNDWRIDQQYPYPRPDDRGQHSWRSGDRPKATHVNGGATPTPTTYAEHRKLKAEKNRYVSKWS